MPKIVTRQTRIAETREATDKLNVAIRAALDSEHRSKVTDEERAKLWADVAREAGQVQRRTRQLAGLGRGG